MNPHIFSLQSQGWLAGCTLKNTLIWDWIWRFLPLQWLLQQTPCFLWLLDYNVVIELHEIKAKQTLEQAVHWGNSFTFPGFKAWWKHLHLVCYCTCCPQISAHTAKGRPALSPGYWWEIAKGITDVTISDVGIYRKHTPLQNENFSRRRKEILLLGKKC